MDRKIITIIVLSLLCCILAYIAFKPTTYSYSEELIKKISERYEAKEKVLKETNSKILSQNVNYKHTLDSINKVKPKIEKKYDKIYRDVDIHTSHSLVNEFDVIFANDTIN